MEPRFFDRPVTAAELIEILQQIPADTEVGGWEYHHLPIYCISMGTVTFDEDTPNGLVSKQKPVCTISFHR